MLTASSSTKRFAAAGKAWLQTVVAHPLLTDANKTLGTALYLKFNNKHYEKTGELKAWPAWDTLTAESGLSRTTINESVRQLEHFQLLNVKRGRYDRAAQRREGNEYFARFPSPQGANSVPYQGTNSVSNPRYRFLTQPRYADCTVSGDSPLLIGESIKADSPLTVQSAYLGVGKDSVPTEASSEAAKSTEAAPPEAARRGRPSEPSARGEVQPRKLTGDLEASLNRLAARPNGGGR